MNLKMVKQDLQLMIFGGNPVSSGYPIHHQLRELAVCLATFYLVSAQSFPQKEHLGLYTIPAEKCRHRFIPRPNQQAPGPQNSAPPGRLFASGRCALPRALRCRTERAFTERWAPLQPRRRVRLLRLRGSGEHLPAGN